MPRLSLLDDTVTQDAMNVFSKPTKSFESPRGDRAPGDSHLAAVCRLEATEACATVGSGLQGLSQSEADTRLKKFGLNLVTRERKATILQELWGRARNPLNALLLTLATVSYFLGDVRAAIVIATMVILAITTAFIQEHRSNKAAAQLRAMVHTTASVRRGLSFSDNPFSEIPMAQLVPGDVVRLSAGDMIPGDLRLLEAKDLFINQSALTGEAMPGEARQGERRILRRPVRPAKPMLHGRQRRVRLRHRRASADRPKYVLRSARRRDSRAARPHRL
jgi:P-type Mg2+ transporter